MSEKFRELIGRNRFFAKRVQNNSDPASVLEAGWSAMQQLDPRLAEAIQKMPPQVAQQAVLQYTNAIRMGKESEASKMATDQVRIGLTEFAKNPPAQPPQTGMGRFGRAPSAGYEISDVNAFDGAMNPPQSKGFLPGAAAFGAQPRTPDAAAAFKGVKDSYNKYNYANREVVMPGDALAQKDLSAPPDWLPRPRPASDPNETTPNSNFNGWM